MAYETETAWCEECLLTWIGDEAHQQAETHEKQEGHAVVLDTTYVDGTRNPQQIGD